MGRPYSDEIRDNLPAFIAMGLSLLFVAGGLIGGWWFIISKIIVDN
jgi:hypothetical protein